MRRFKRGERSTIAAGDEESTRAEADWRRAARLTA
jgi:hypothetical protein